MAQQVKIQMKVYDTDGKRVEVAEALLPECLTAQDAAAWIKIECLKLSQKNNEHQKL